MEQHQPCSNSTIAEADRKLEQIKLAIGQFKQMKGALIPVLHEVQDVYGFLPEPVLQVVSAELDLPMSEIYGVASFYHFFAYSEGEHVIHVCMGTACYIKGAQGILDRLSTELKVPVQGTTEDDKFTLEATRCLGACGLAPVLTIGEKVHGRLTPNAVPKMLKEYN